MTMCSLRYSLSNLARAIEGRIGATECGTGAPILSAINYRQSQWACVLSTAA